MISDRRQSFQEASCQRNSLNNPHGNFTPSSGNVAIASFLCNELSADMAVKQLYSVQAQYKSSQAIQGDA